MCRRRSRKASHCDLALAADVEDIRAKGDADADADEKERDRLHGGGAERIAAAERARDERPVTGRRVRAEGGEHHGADEERGERR
jgi:hypothetical protein